MNKNNKKNKIITITIWAGLFIISLLILFKYYIPRNDNKPDDFIYEDIYWIEADKDDTIYSLEKVPFVSMPESAISSTALGRYTTMEKCTDFDHLRITHQYKTYEWKREGEIIFRATVRYDDDKGWYVSDIWDVSHTNNKQAIERAPYVGMYVTESDLCRWLYPGKNDLTDGRPHSYTYDVGDYSYSILVDEKNIVTKVSTTIRGKR